MEDKTIAVNIDTLIADVIFFVKDDLLNNITDPISGSRSSKSRFVMTAYPQRPVDYPIITVKVTNIVTNRAGLQTTAVDINLDLEVRVWARNQREKDSLWTDVMNRLRTIQFTASTGSVASNLHDFNMPSATEVDEDGERGIKSRVGTVSYFFAN